MRLRARNNTVLSVLPPQPSFESHAQAAAQLDFSHHWSEMTQQRKENISQKTGLVDAWTVGTE